MTPPTAGYRGGMDATGPSPASAAHPFDARPLTDPVDPGAVAAYAREVRAMEAQRETPLSRVIVYVIIGILAVSMLTTLATVAGAMISTGFAGAPWVLLIALLVVAAIVVGIIAYRRRKKVRRYRLHAFARANAMEYLPSLTDPRLPGMIFNDGHSRRTDDIMRGQHPRFVEFGNYQYTTGSGKNSTTHHWGYVAIRLDVPLPNIVLDAQSNNGLFGTNLPARFAKHQRLSLEGDFDKYFALYCPAGYERDALYLFTPDIMVRFMDRAAQFDVEIVDDWLFLYINDTPVTTLEPARWARLFETVGAVIQKFDQWARWRDERLRTEAQPAAFAAAPGAPVGHAGAPTGPAVLLPPPAGVAPAGRRLKRSRSWITWFGIAVVLFFILIQAMRIGG